MWIESPVKRAVGLFVICVTTLCGLGAAWGAFAWKNQEPPANTLPFAQSKQIVMGPFREDAPGTSGALTPMPGMRLLSREPQDGLEQGFQALYLADYETETDALDRWELYTKTFPNLNVFRAFAISSGNEGKNNKVSMVAMLKRFDLPEEAARKIIDESCSALQWQGYVCLPVYFSLNMDEFQNRLEAVAGKAGEKEYATGPMHPTALTEENNPIQRHQRAREQARGDNSKNQGGDDLDLEHLDRISPAAGLYDALEDPPVANSTAPERLAFKNRTPDPEDDTVAQAAMRAAFEMVRNRYEDAIYQAKMNGGETDIASEDAVALTQSAITSAAERAFESFMRESYGKRDFEGRTYDGLRGYFVTAFTHAAKASIKSVGKRFVRDITEDGNFKSLAIRSEILNSMDEEMAKAFIDTGLAAAKNSQYAFLRNLEVSYKIRENNKPQYSLLTLQPLYSSKGKHHNLFAQAAYSRQDGRNSFTGGFGYRFMPENENYVVGSNIFLDYERPYNHVRGGVGIDLQTSLWGAAANLYKGLSDWKSTKGYLQERAMDGFDIELNGRMPFLPALEVFGRGYRWQGFDGAEDIDGTELRLEYTPVPAFTIEGLVNDEHGRDTQYGFGVRYNYTFGAPSDYLYDWNEQFRQKSASEYIFSKVRRQNKIRVQQRIDPAAVSAGIIPAGLLASSPLNGATGLAIGIDVSLTFDQDVQAGAGNIVFTDLTDGSDNFTIPVGDPRVTIVNDTVTIDLSAQLLDYLSNYEVTFASGVFEDLSGNATAALGPGGLDFTTVDDPTAGFPAATTTLAPGGTSTSLEPATNLGTFETTIDIGAAPDGVIFESGATGQGIAASFGGGNLVFAAGDGASTATGTDSIFGTYPIASIAQGLHHFVFVAEPTAPAEIGLYIDGIRVINQSIAGAMQSGEWAGTNGSGYGLVNSSIRAGVNSNAISGATLISNLSFYSGVAPAGF